MAADSAPVGEAPGEVGELRTKVAKLTEINRALMQRVEHGLDLRVNGRVRDILLEEGEKCDGCDQFSDAGEWANT